MQISIYTQNVTDAQGWVAVVDVAVEITHSPSEGFDNEKLGELEGERFPGIF